MIPIEYPHAAVRACRHVKRPEWHANGPQQMQGRATASEIEYQHTGGCQGAHYEEVIAADGHACQRQRLVICDVMQRCKLA